MFFTVAEDWTGWSLCLELHSKMSRGQESRCPLTFHLTLYNFANKNCHYHCLLTSQIWYASACAHCTHLWSIETLRTFQALKSFELVFHTCSFHQQHKGSDPGPSRSQECVTSKTAASCLLFDPVCQILVADLVCALQSRKIRHQCSHKSFYKTSVAESSLKIWPYPSLSLSTSWLYPHAPLNMPLLFSELLWSQHISLLKKKNGNHSSDLFKAVSGT